MSDRELLAWAAKAAGIELIQMPPGIYRNVTGASPGTNLFGMPTWNPYDDDGDALRLAVKLRMCVGIIPSNIKNGCATVTLAPANPVEIVETHNNDPLAATRRAIVRAAAEIGRQMP